MAKAEVIKNRKKFREDALANLYKAYEALAAGQVQSYTIGSRSLTKFDLEKLMEEIRKLEKEIDKLDRLLQGSKRRKAVGIVPRDI